MEAADAVAPAGVAVHADSPEVFERKTKHDVVSAFEELRELGPVVRCVLPFFGTTHVLHRREDLRQVLSSDGRDVVLQPVMGPLAPYFGVRSVICLDGAEHLARRKVVLPAFAGAALPAMEGELRALAAEIMPTWVADEPQPLLPRTQALTFAAILQVAFGIRDRERAAEIGESLRAHFVAAGRGLVRDATPVEDLMQSLLDERRAAQHDRRDLLGLLLSARTSDGASLDDATLRDELLTTLTAGHETTATGIAWAAVLLADHPELVHRLRAERAVGQHALLDATVDELLRLRPPLMGTSRVATVDVEIAGAVLPAGAHITLSTLLVHLDPARYPQPHEFRPERFLGTKPVSVDFLPFGGGRHRCAGAAFAYLELRIAIEALLDRYDLTCHGSAPTVALVVNTHVPRDGAIVQISHRASAGAT